MAKQNTAPTMKDVAKEAGVSLGTVSKVINGIPVGDEYRKKVEQAIKTLDYHINAYAKGLKNNRTYTVAVILPNLLNPFFSMVAHYINRALVNRGYRMLLCDTEYDYTKEREMVQMVAQNKVDGIIALTYNPDLKIPPDVRSVSIDRYLSGSTTCVASDNYNGGRLAAQKLVENGCKDIIALRIFGFGIEKRFRIPDDVHVTTIGPTVDLGNILNFDAEQSRQNMRLGYFDAQRVLYGLYGSTYYIDRTMSEDAARQQLLEYLGPDEGSLRTFHEKTLPQIAKALKCDGDYYDLLIAVLEHDAKELGIESERIMTDMELLQAILAQPEQPEAILPTQESDAPTETEPEASDGTQSAAPKATEEVAAKAAELSQDIEKHINRLLGKMRPRRNHPGTAENAEPETAADETEK